ncbi:hypothetical protein APR40_06055 [Salegentibacter salarius]|uniref:Uncharacterized protein n=1 Tax=Salegentibacter salarius TaxID=435906 RepID=A0A2N0TMM3_9FLAO|nr:hypothetical protein [Salegentibacter salarius]OEY71466.1 hypothetical protein BHS39_06060 [Salegentibacter salarius]PKD15995.1 hypothetical protein APR40_06055 [Salegentibacter salarius]SLJ91443.1 hypothetical protein SAMN05660445_01117 [Salegentibacter salarius]
MSQSKNKQWIGERSKFLLTGSIIGLIIAFSPYLFYLYEIFPSSPVWENSFFTYESKYYENVLTAAWTYLGKIVPLLLLSIWFFTCKHWWYHVILVPVIMYGFQLVTAFYEDAYTDSNIMMDTNQLIYLAPFFIVILSIVYLIRVKIFDRIYGIDLSEIDETDVSVFSPISETDRREVKSFQEEEQYWEPAQEDYYTQL